MTSATFRTRRRGTSYFAAEPGSNGLVRCGRFLFRKPLVTMFAMCGDSAAGVPKPRQSAAGAWSSPRARVGDGATGAWCDANPAGVTVADRKPAVSNGGDDAGPCIGADSEPLAGDDASRQLRGNGARFFARIYGSSGLPR